jgi:predicted transposase/invertase (TIGR01784 family)
MKTPVLDHVIITEHSYYSFKESGLLNSLEESTKYVMPYELEKQYYQEMQEAIKAEQRKSKKKIAESLKKGEEKGRKEGIQLGEARGKEEGIQTKAVEIAKNLLSKNVAENFISEATGLPLEEVAKLKQGSSIAHLD